MSLCNVENFFSFLFFLLLLLVQRGAKPPIRVLGGVRLIYRCDVKRSDGLTPADLPKKAMHDFSRLLLVSAVLEPNCRKERRRAKFSKRGGISPIRGWARAQKETDAG